MEALVIGRHTSEIPNVQVVETRNVTFPATATESAEVLTTLIQECRERGFALILQNAPTPVAAALPRIRQPMLVNQVRVGLVVSVPSAMPSEPQVKTFQVYAEGYDESSYATVKNHKAIADAVKFANPRATVSTEIDAVLEGHSVADVVIVTVTVEQPRPFEFSHIEWL